MIKILKIMIIRKILPTEIIIVKMVVMVKIKYKQCKNENNINEAKIHFDEQAMPRCFYFMF